jgi:hypothetical protein
VEDVSAELGIGQGRHVDVGDGAEELHRLHGPAVGAIKDRLGGAHGHASVIAAHEGDERLEGFGAVLTR